MALPEVGLAQDAGAGLLGGLERAREAGDEPEQARRDVEVALLRAFQGFVVFGAIASKVGWIG